MNFDNKIEIDKIQVLKLFMEHEKERKELDCFAIEIIGKLCNANHLKYHKCTITSNGLTNIVLPWHCHCNIDLIPKGGLKMMESIKKFREKANQNPEAICIRKVLDMYNQIEKDFDYSFLLLSNDNEAVHAGHYNNHEGSPLYIANGFHRLLAVGLHYAEKNIFKSFEIYYAQK